MANPTKRFLCAAILTFTTLSCTQNAHDQEAVGPTHPANSSAAATAAIVQYNQIHQPMIGKHGMVVSQNTIATSVGHNILAMGGNAVDAAVATAFALAVTLPRAGNIGGSGFLLHRAAKSGRLVALDFRSAAPQEFRPKSFANADGHIDSDDFEFGAIAAGVPGTIAGLWNAWQRFGSLPWQELVAPAQALAEQGIQVTADLAFALGAAEPLFRQFPSSAQTYLTPAGNSHVLGAILKQPDLGWSLQQIGAEGADAFYRGTVGRKLVDAVRKGGGVMTLADLDAYQVRERTPLYTTYRGYKVHAMPPVSGGGVTLLQMLNMLSEFTLSNDPQGSAEQLHLVAEVMKQGAANRRYGIGDPDYAAIDMASRLSPRWAKRFASDISRQHVRPVTEVQPGEIQRQQSRDTTHLSVVDAEGNAVSLTYTLGYSFGSGFVAEGTGILLDNQMKNFYYDKPGHANQFAPGKRMMSTMTPTIVTDPDGQLFLVTGTPGGSRIINVILQMLINTIDYKMDVATATQAPRIHHNWSEPNPNAPTPWSAPRLQVEQGVSIDTRRLLAAKGHEVEVTQTIGSTQSIMVRDGLLFGSADPRRPDAAAMGLIDKSPSIPVD